MLDKLVTVKLDKDRHMKLGMRGLLEFEKVTGKNLLRGFSLDELTLHDTAVLMWASLIHEDKELKLDTVIDMVDITNIQMIADALGSCVTQSLPVAKENTRPLPRKKSRRG